jgi:hypothetical protein
MSTARKSNVETGSELAMEKVTPFPQQPARLATERIRPELNLEKWAIWKPSKSKNPPSARVIERELALLNGDKVTAKVKVGFTDDGELTTEDQKTYYGLIKYWEERGHSDKQTFFSLNQLRKMLKKKWGTNVKDSLTQSLIRLRTIPFTWTNAYYDAITKETVEEINIFNILSELKIIKRKKDGSVNREFGYFRFNDFILNNLRANHTKPLLFDTVISFRSEVAQILYTYLDLILADKTLYERRTKELFDDLSLQGKAYINPSKRKQILDPALKELHAAPLTTGRIASITLEPTKDERDYKLVVRKGKLVALPKINHYQEEQNSEPVADQVLKRSKGEADAPQRAASVAVQGACKLLL